MRINRKNLFQDTGYVEHNYGHQVEANDTNTPFKDGTARPWLELLDPSAAENVFKNLLDVDVSKETTLKEEATEDITGNLLATPTYQQAAEGYYLAEATDDIFYTDDTDLWQTENNNGSDDHHQEATDITYVLDSFCGHASPAAKELDMKKCLVGDSVQSRLKEVLQKRKLAEGVQDVKTDIVPVKRKRVEVDECPPVTNKKLRRQTQNRNAARRFREKQRSTIETLSMKSDALKEVNTKLRTERSFLLRKRDELKKYIDRHTKLCPSANASDPGVVNIPINQTESGITPPFLTVGKILVEVEYQGKTVLEEKTLAEITQLLGTSWPHLGSEHAVNLVVNSTGSCVQREVKPDLVGGNNLQDTFGFTTVMLTPDHSPECGRAFNYTVKECGDSSAADYLAASLPHTPEASPDHNQCSSVFTFDENNSGPSRSNASSPSVPQTPRSNPSPVPVPSNGDINGQQAEGGEPNFFTLLKETDFETACVDIWKYSNGLKELSAPVLSPIIDPEKVTPGVKVEVDLKVWESSTSLTSDWSGIALADFCLNSEELAAYSFSTDDLCASLDGVR